MKTSSKDYTILHSTEYVDVAGIKGIPAKIDTGADTSAIWASDIKMESNGLLSFVLLNKNIPLYSGERITTDHYTAKSIRSSHGDKQIRYQVKLDITLKGQSFKTTFTLANRSNNHFPVLIGRRTIKNRFLVDVSKSSIERPKASTTAQLNQELKTNPMKFHQKYIERSK